MQRTLGPVKSTIECTHVNWMRNTIRNGRFTKSPTPHVCDDQHKKVRNQDKNNRTEHQQQSDTKWSSQPLSTNFHNLLKDSYLRPGQKGFRLDKRYLATSLTARRRCIFSPVRPSDPSDLLVGVVTALTTEQIAEASRFEIKETPSNPFELKRQGEFRKSALG